MKNRVIRCLAFCLPVCLLIAGCQSPKKSFIPVTGANAISIPARVETARSNVLEYMISSAQLEDAPPKSDWQLDTAQRTEGEYRFVNGDWLMIVWPANAQQKNEKVILRNQAALTDWCGYVRPDGHVVDTSYMP